MLTLRSEVKLIDRLKSLSELELSGVMSELHEHLIKNKMMHILENEFRLQNDIIRIEELESELSDLERDNERMNDTLFNIKVIASKADDIEEYEEESFDELKRFINEIKNEL